MNGDGAAVGFDYGLGEEEAHAEAAGALGVAWVAALEDDFAQILRDARATVNYVYGDAALRLVEAGG